jgi:hypothetical protein
LRLPFIILSPSVVFVGWAYCVATGGGISMPGSAATSMILLALGWSSEAGGLLCKNLALALRLRDTQTTAYSSKGLAGA